MHGHLELALEVGAPQIIAASARGQRRAARAVVRPAGALARLALGVVVDRRNDRLHQDMIAGHFRADMLSSRTYIDAERARALPEARFVCKACGKRGAAVRPDFIGTAAGRSDGLSLVPWSSPFHKPIPPPKEKPLRTLKDAADYILKLPKKTAAAPHWQLAMEQLIDAAEGRNFVMHARIGVLRALNHDRDATTHPAEPPPTTI